MLRGVVMKKFKIFKSVLKSTRADRILLSFVMFYFASAFIIMIFEPNINTYGDALWYCYTVFSTTGFGTFETTTFVGKVISVILTIYTLGVVAIVTGVVVSFYTHYVQLKYDNSIFSMMDKLENLEKLSKEELREISERVKKNR